MSLKDESKIEMIAHLALIRTILDLPEGVRKDRNILADLKNRLRRVNEILVGDSIEDLPLSVKNTIDEASKLISLESC